MILAQAWEWGEPSPQAVPHLLDLDLVILPAHQPKGSFGAESGSPKSCVYFMPILQTNYFISRYYIRVGM